MNGMKKASSFLILPLLMRCCRESRAGNTNKQNNPTLHITCTNMSEVEICGSVDEIFKFFEFPVYLKSVCKEPPPRPDSWMRRRGGGTAASR